MIDESKLIEELNCIYPMTFDSIQFIRKGGSQSYSVWSDSSQYLLKIISKTFNSTITHSLDVQKFLYGKDFPVPGIVLNCNKLPSSVIRFGGESYTCVLFEFVKGHELEQGERVEDVGELVGRLHCDMGNYNGELVSHSKKFFIDRYIELLKMKSYSFNKIKRFSDYGDELWKRVKELPKGYCHGDLHRGNILVAPNNQLYLLDFDGSCMSHRMFDIMVMCDSTDYFNFKEDGLIRSKNILQRFLCGYSKYCDVTEEEVATFYDWIAIRHFSASGNYS